MEFDPDAFAETFVQAHVNSVTLFAKCHHGYAYHPTRAGIAHPYLNGRDVLGEQIEALHRRGILAPIYFTVGWDEYLAFHRPEWRQIKYDGTFADQEHASDRQTEQPGRWKFMNFNDPAYRAHMAAHLEEILTTYPVDGVFFDIVFFHPEGGFSEDNRAFRARHGLLEPTSANQARFQALARVDFAKQMTALVHAHHPEATTFYNSGHTFSVDAAYGLRAMEAGQTHWEIESLPSGFWGYYHFPRFVRHVATLEKPWLGMTGRFQLMWGDFGGIKPQAALEFECFRSQAHGGGNSVGDQLPPRGTLEPAAYDLIGRVYAQVEAAEPFYQGSTAWPDVGMLLASHPTTPKAEASHSEEGAVLMLEEMHYNPLLLDDTTDLRAYRALLLPDSVVVDETLADRLRAYYEAGGHLILSYRSGFDVDGDWRLDFLPLAFEGKEVMQPTYWRMSPSFWSGNAVGDRVFYEAGMRVLGLNGAQTLAERVFPYFRRSDTHYMSHFQAPPLAHEQAYPAIVQGERFVYFADPLFRVYRHYGATFYRDVLEHILHTLIGLPEAGAGLPRTVLALPRRRGSDLVLTLLHYVPIRKATRIDVIEEASSFAGEKLVLPRLPEGVRPRLFREEPLPQVGPYHFALPVHKGRLLIECPGYFAAAAEEAS